MKAFTIYLAISILLISCKQRETSNSISKEINLKDYIGLTAKQAINKLSIDTSNLIADVEPHMNSGLWIIKDSMTIHFIFDTSFIQVDSSNAKTFLATKIVLGHYWKNKIIRKDGYHFNQQDLKK